ncbi:sensor histidine kinase [Salisediminibacterium selenitireducens]|uniref:histidine kinase n=1 Tax=Bacillus selenitireducens (strain ATCC 700615 / DSM 15326 / MLS10) TaxID=439292 RepID=D6XXV6_BACIE|nr:HAMP domain-containing sensor histidine kinase [Salisediminibacterium selenitireducens]ADI00149.1 integral membrane sensor signal transduction histidine kinase [[Bacillus] selenitireducens MLS10]
MRWRLTSRYFISLLLLVVVVLLVNTTLFFALLFYQNADPERSVSGESMETFVRSFDQYLSLDHGEVKVSSEGLTELEQRGAWLQVLDDTGSEVMSVRKPDHVLEHYSPMELIHRYKYMDDHLHQYFVGDYEAFSYLIGAPELNESRWVMMIHPQSVIDFTGRALIIMLTLNVLIAIGFGLLFSSGIIKPVYQLIDEIRRIKYRDYRDDGQIAKGIFEPVFANLQDVSRTYEYHEQEREKLEVMRTEWINNVSHDLKTPLASVQGYAELLKDNQLSQADQHRYAEVIERQSRYMKELIDDFHLTMKLRHQELPLSFESVAIEGFVRELVIQVLNEPRFEEADITFHSDASDICWQIDRHLYFRAVMNLLRNALVHNDDDVSIKVNVHSDRIEISDTGKGITRENQEQIFERYYKGTNTEDGEGSGLGMAIARDIIESHGGSVDLDSEEGMGTTITIFKGSQETLKKRGIWNDPSVK